MKIFIMSDLEGVAGVINRNDFLFPTSRHYETARRLLTEEVNAAVEGLAAGGFTEFLIADGHGAGAINIELLDPRARLIRGWGAAPYPFGLDRGFDAMAYVGQHAKAGTVFSHLTHTGSCQVLDQKINGVSIGEYGEGALSAGELNIPMVFAAGEKAFCAEAEKLTPWVVTAAVIEGVIGEPGNDLCGEEYATFHEGAIHMQPLAACDLIRRTAERAARRFVADRALFKPLRLNPPYRLERQIRPFNGQPAHTMVREHANSIIALLNGKFA